MSRDAVAGFRPLLRATLRHDARNIAPWIALITALSASSVLAYGWVFPDPASRLSLSAAIGGNPALGLLFGPARDLSTADGFNTWRAQALGGFFAALMAILIVIRHSRADEDTGQAELVAAGVVGRHTRLAVAVAVAVLASVGLGVVCSIATILVGGGLAASIALSATFTASGLMFAGLAAITAQLGSYARTANAMAITVLGTSFLVRGYLDAGDHPDWIWVTPLGWTQEVRPATANNWWPLLACLGLAVALVVAANVLLARRDFGMGLVPPSPGPARGGAAAGVWGLAFRLHRGSVLAWSAAFVLLGLVFGSLATSLGDVFAHNSEIARIIAVGGGAVANGLVFEFLSTLLKIVGIIAAVYGVQIVLRIHTEETESRVEPLLAGALSRSRYLASNAVVALLGPAAGLLLAGSVIGAIASTKNPAVHFGDLVSQALAEIPAVWLLIGLALAVVGANPKARAAAWLGVVATFALTILGPIFRLWDWILGISPLYHVPNVTAPNPVFTGLAAVSAVAVFLIAVGFAGFRRRDVPLP